MLKLEDYKAREKERSQETCAKPTYFIQGLLLDPSFLNYEISGYRNASRSLNLATSESVTLKYPPCFSNRV